MECFPQTGARYLTGCFLTDCLTARDVGRLSRVLFARLMSCQCLGVFAGPAGPRAARAGGRGTVGGLPQWHVIRSY